MIRKYCLSLLLTLVALVTPAFAQRATLDLTDNWKFIKKDVALDATTDSWETVNVPHTWNVADGASGKAENGYYRGPGWYARSLDIPDTWKGKRVFIRFEAASLVADVFVNGQKVGEHRGGFAAFSYDITPFLHFDGKDFLRVKVDNTRFLDIPPLDADFTVFGGIYRPVHLIATDSVDISPIYFASSGVFIQVKSIRSTSASVDVRTVFSSKNAVPTDATLLTEIKDASGKVVATQTTPVHIIPDAPQPSLAEAISEASTMTPTPNSTVQSFEVVNPHLWQGKQDPYLYSVTTHLLVAGKEIDAVTQPLGIRTVAIVDGKGFQLNGQTYAMHGVNRHQEKMDKGWALSNDDHDEDFKLIEEVGATCVRLAHYQQCEHVHDLADHDGIILWQEVPCVDGVSGTPEFTLNAQQQMTEMILQDYNHPSQGMWGLFNELNASWVKDVPKDPPNKIIRSLQTLANRLDPDRPTVAASQVTHSDSQPDPLLLIPSWVCFNIYPGWYDGWGDVNNFNGNVAKGVEGAGNKMVGISEYGGGANTTQHTDSLKQPVPTGQFHPEEYQAYLHERAWSQFKDNPHVWGTYVWAMFDFASCSRNEGGIPGVNDKGLVTRDREIKKDSFYFYKANWNPEPMVYITSRRFTERKEASVKVKIYSNCDSVELKVNGQSLGSAKPNDLHIVQWDEVKLSPGQNTIEANAQSVDKTLTDQCQWSLGSVHELK